MTTVLNKTTATNWVIYGATGETGQRIVQQALQRGHRPMLAGRSATKLKALAQTHQLPWCQLDLNQPTQLEALLGSVDLIVNVANPFEQTRPPLLAAALANGTHYVDLANDMDNIQQIFDHDQEAKKAGVGALTGVGFGTIASGCLLKYLHAQLPEANNAEIVSSIYTDVLSPGALLSSVAELGDIGLVIRQGQPHRLASKDRIKPGSDRASLVVAPMGDLQAAYVASGIPNIQFLLALGVPYYLARLSNGYLGLLAKINRQWVEQGLKMVTPLINTWKQFTRPKNEVEQSSVSIRLTQGGGRWVEATLVTGEGYEFTAQVTVLTVEHLLSTSEPVAGAMIPAQILPADFVLQVKGVHRIG